MTETEFKGPGRGGARPGSGPKPYTSDASGEDVAAFLASIVEDKAAPVTARVRAGIELTRMREREEERREDARIRRYNDEQMKLAGL